jgi:hypothetical protein
MELGSLRNWNGHRCIEFVGRVEVGEMFKNYLKIFRGVAGLSECRFL